MFSFQNLVLAYYQCRNRKRAKLSSINFEFSLEKEIYKLKEQLKGKTYKPDKFSVFVITSPKTREIFAADFKDRVVHHLLHSYLSPIFEPKFIYDSYACRKGKGTHRAIKRLSKLLRKTTEDSSSGKIFLQADIKSFFTSIDRDILYSLIKKHVNNPEILYLVDVIINHNCTQDPIRKGQLSLFTQIPAHKSLFNVPLGKGLPIGNLTSQFFANVYLNELDQFVKHKLKCKYYIRYVDDFVILGNSQKDLYEIKAKIEDFLEEKLLLQLHPKKWKIEEVSKGIDFLGYVVKPTHILVRKRVVNSLKNKLFHFQKGDLTKNYMLSCINSYYAHFRHADSYRLRKNIYIKHFKKLKRYFRPVDGYKYFKLR